MNEKSKKRIYGVLAAVLAFGFACSVSACGSGNTPDKKDDGKDSEYVVPEIDLPEVPLD